MVADAHEGIHRADALDPVAGPDGKAFVGTRSAQDVATDVGPALEESEAVGGERVRGVDAIHVALQDAAGVGIFGEETADGIDGAVGVDEEDGKVGGNRDPKPAVWGVPALVVLGPDLPARFIQVPGMGFEVMGQVGGMEGLKVVGDALKHARDTAWA